MEKVKQFKISEPLLVQVIQILQELPAKTVHNVLNGLTVLEELKPDAPKK